MNDCRHGSESQPPVLLGTDDPVAASAFEALGKIFHLHRQAMQKFFTTSETHHGEVFSLRLLARHDGLSQRDLADTLHLSRPRVTSILQGLEKAGAVRRENDPSDQRLTRVFLTDEGRRLEAEHKEAFEAYLSQTVGTLSDADKKELARLLDEVSARIAAMLCNGAIEKEGL